MARRPRNRADLGVGETEIRQVDVDGFDRKNRTLLLSLSLLYR
jgi:hypothetical protein